MILTGPEVVFGTENINSMFSEAWDLIGAKQNSGLAHGKMFTVNSSHPSREGAKDWNWNFYYHTWVHIVQIIHLRNKIIPNIPMSPEAILSIYYHDIIYDPFKKDNEERSADFAIHEMAGASQETCDRVRIIIEGTKTHLNPIDKDMGRVLDLDLAAGLGGSYETFLHNGSRIRNEYEDAISDELFSEKRIEFLSKFLERKFIFSTRQFRCVFEKNVRNNINRLIKSNA